MSKAKKKTAKARLDKYYKLAKEQGYRARSAFKLIQLNKKFAFLESARCCIDLCAAPGGWLQVASKYMPVNSLIVGVDLTPIRPIPRVVTFTADITASKCRDLIRDQLKDWKADVVLHDGAPNVGTAWIQDAYSQSELVVMSLKLAVEFLAKGGTYVTKVFRSVDYNNLIWVFNQLFGKVEATKPPSSRNVSAEIFVVCRDFLAPKHIDPKFLDPKHVFKDLAASAPSGAAKGAAANDTQANVFQPQKKRRHRDGYDEGDYTLFHKISVDEFVRSSDPISILGRANKLAFETEEEKRWLTLDITTLDITTNCDDLKVLGKGDFKALLKWRTALREELGLEVKTRHAEELTEHVEVTEEVDEDQAIQEELERLNAEATARTKRERRRANEIKTKTIRRMQLNMAAPLDIGLEQTDSALRFGQDDIFDLGHVEREMKTRGRQWSPSVEDRDLLDSEEEISGTGLPVDDEMSGDEVTSEDEERRRRAEGLEAELDGLYEAYQDRLKERDAKFRVREARKNKTAREEWQGIAKPMGDDEAVSNSEDDGNGGWDCMQAAKEDTGEVSSSDESESGEEPLAGHKRKRSTEREPPSKRACLVTTLEEKPSYSDAAKIWFNQDLFAGIKDGDEEEEEEEEEEKEEGEEEGEGEENEEEELGDDVESVDREVARTETLGPNDSIAGESKDPPAGLDEDAAMWDYRDEDEDKKKQATIQKHGLITAEAVTLAMQLVNRETTKTQLINDGFSRYSLNSKDGLPSWFLDDESKHYKLNLPVTKEAIAALRAKQRALDARPIKKVAEAKARKKFKAAQRLEKAMKKAEGVNAAADVTEREKAQQIEKLMRKGSGGKRKKEVQVVVAKGVNKGTRGRPKGVKGRYTMVDARMKKETRAKKRRDKASKKRKRS